MHLTNLSYSEKLFNSSPTHIIVGMYEGEKIWYHMKIPPSKLSLMAIAIKSKKHIDVNVYGKIINYGWGEPPKLSA